MPSQTNGTDQSQLSIKAQVRAVEICNLRCFACEIRSYIDPATFVLFNRYSVVQTFPDMKNTQEMRDVTDQPAWIVRIAYRQLSVMTGVTDPCVPRSDPGTIIEKPVFNSARRLLELPILASFTSTVSSAYTSIKQSHVTVMSMLNTTEEGLEKGVELVSPITEKIGTTLETPLKSVDSVICMGLDFLEENVPTISRPTLHFFDFMQTCFRSTVSSMAGFYLSAVNSIQNISQITIEDVKANDSGENGGAKKNY